MFCSEAKWLRVGLVPSYTQLYYVLPIKSLFVACNCTSATSSMLGFRVEAQWRETIADSAFGSVLPSLVAFGMTSDRILGGKRSNRTEKRVILCSSCSAVELFCDRVLKFNLGMSSET